MAAAQLFLVSEIDMYSCFDNFNDDFIDYGMRSPVFQAVLGYDK